MLPNLFLTQKEFCKKNLQKKKFWQKNFSSQNKIRQKNFPAKFCFWQKFCFWEKFSFWGKFCFWQKFSSWQTNFIAKYFFCEIFFGWNFLGEQKSVQNGPRDLRLKFGQNWVSNSWDITDIEFLWVGWGGVVGIYSHFRVQPPTIVGLRLRCSWVGVLTTWRSLVRRELQWGKLHKDHADWSSPSRRAEARRPRDKNARERCKIRTKFLKVTTNQGLVKGQKDHR